MSLRSIKFEDTYWSGENNLIDDFYIPCLEESIEYCRAVGYFSSSILCYIANGLFPFIMNGGRIRIICSVNLSENDAREIALGYNIKELIASKIDLEVQKLLSLNIANVKNLCWLIKNDRLDIKVCMRQDKEQSHKIRLFHEKFGIFRDSDNNMISFLGSINETMSGWLDNEESFEVSTNWIPVLESRVQKKQQRFENLWNNEAAGIITYDFPSAARQCLIQNSPEEPLNQVFHKVNKTIQGFRPRKCQEEAKDKFIASNYKCLFMMATGAGKTKAALYAISQVEQWKLMLICAPGIELVEQWEQDVNLFFPKVHVIKCSSINPVWQTLLLALIQAKIPSQTVVISTYDSAIKPFSMDKWKSIKPSEFALICDEVHNMGALTVQQLMELRPQYRIGLSATPERNFDELGSEKILDFYDHNRYEFSIRDAQRAKYLVEYEYRIIPCPLEDDQWELYMDKCHKINKLKQDLKSDKIRTSQKEKYMNQLETLYRDRAGIIKKCDNKDNYIEEMLNALPSDARILIYGDDLEQLGRFKIKLNSMNKQYFEYTGDKDPAKTRPVMLKEFRQGIRKILLAVGCLDEGIDIPACDAAIFVSSSTSERQFIQRRGRVLRNAPGKRQAWVFDFLVYPKLMTDVSDEELKIAKKMIESQYNRINLIANDAINGLQERTNLDAFLSFHKLNPYEY